MSPATTTNLLSALFVIFCAFLGSIIVEVYGSPAISGLVIGSIFGLVLVLIDRLLQGFSLRAFSSATFGLFLGFLFATLLRASGMLRYLTEREEWVLSLCVYAAFGYLGMMLAMRSNRDEFALVIPYVRFTREALLDSPLVLDTNVIIDGRLIDLCESGFLSRQIVVPHFILMELQHLAESDDEIRRSRGRRGLDNLNRLKSLPTVSLTMHETQPDPSKSVDQMLIQAAHFLKARLLTNDTDLSKVARLQNIPVLHMRDLERAMRPAVGPGDEVELDLVKEGRDPHQAVGYLSDGTMIVVNHARQFIGETVPVIVGGALHTSAGRLYFAELRNARPGS